MLRSIDGVLISGSLARIRLEFDWNRDWNRTGIGLEFDWNLTGIGPERDARLFGGVCTNRVLLMNTQKRPYTLNVGDTMRAPWNST